ncbi:MAG: hypothetical protein DRI75_03415 [Bacteroidetes bacterium]|nr:MAG: hypothetical protein DRI75_03415 [Bacteroidota bacterium]
MALKKSNNSRKVGVALTLFSLLAMVIVFEYYKIDRGHINFIIIEIIVFIVFLVSFTKTFIKTGLWKFTHKPLKKLDEREIELTSKSLRYAYGIFTVLVLGLLLSLAVTNLSIDVVLVASLILFAHILPASVIAWTEK